jgi:hypothetical protein
MLNMASDLGFFSIVWGVLILAFSTAMLGAGATDGVRDIQDPSDEDDRCELDGTDDSLPMERWKSWWFIQTYLQSLGQVGIGTFYFHIWLCVTCLDLPLPPER